MFPNNAPRLPMPWIEKIFTHLTELYGSRFADMWRGVDVAGVKTTWAAKLGGFSDRPEAIKAALDALDDKPLPPTLPEFLHLCRDAARRQGDHKNPALECKLSAEQLEKNRARIRELVEGLARSKSAIDGAST